MDALICYIVIISNLFSPAPLTYEYTTDITSAAKMEKASTSKLTYFLEKLEVSSEPGLTNAQLMLTNDDLKPGMPIISVAEEQGPH